jgi:hypothetical protein
LILLFLIATPCGAWNRAGHMVSGAFVYTLLKQQDRERLVCWTAVLKEHPHCGERWLPQLEGVASEDRDQCLWMLAARWPDDIRGDPDYDKPDWHYINYAYKPEGQPDNLATVGPAEVNIVSAFRENLGVLKANCPRAQKAVALCWLLHLVGDVHQPLHTTRLFTQKFPPPEGDRGGTRFYIRATAEAEVISLHKFWDDLILGSEDFRAARNRAVRLRLTHPRETLPELSPTPAESDFRLWAEVEGLALARTKVYQGGQLAGGTTREEGPILPRDYAGTAHPVAQRRLALAAHRLKDLIFGLPKSCE